MTKRRVAEHAAWLHICCARTWGVHPHATASEERSESWQNPCLLRERSWETQFCATDSEKTWWVRQEAFSAANLVVPMVASLGRDSVLLATSAAPLHQEPWRPAEGAALLYWQPIRIG